MPTTRRVRQQREEAAERVGTSTLVPGFLVGLKTTVTGNVSLAKEIIEPEHRVRSGAQKVKWQTERTIENPEEYKKANQVRMKARLAVVSVCSKSAFGLLCPENKITQLEEAIREARRLADAFNRRSRLTRVSIYVISGRIARDDVEAARAIKSEVSDLLKLMSDGVKNLNVKAVRDAANKARSIGAMLAPEAAAQIKDAVDTARSAARKIVKAGEEAAQAIDREAIRKLSQARTAFLDLDSPEGEIVAPTGAARAVDHTPETEETQPGRTPSEDPDQTPPPRRGRRVETEAREDA